MATALVETDLGMGYLKGLGNPAGPHQLACELVGSCLAEWLGAPTLDFAIMRLSEEDEVPIPDGGRLLAGSAFVTRSEPTGFVWGGDSATLEKISNRTSITEMVILDTWTRNCDRYAPDRGRVNLDNVFFVQYPEPRRLCMIIMDFTHAFSCGHGLSKSLGYIEGIRDEKVYGLFPQFHSFLARSELQRCMAKLLSFTPQDAAEILQRVPAEWQVSADVRGAWSRFLYERAHFLAVSLENALWPQARLALEE